MTAPPRRSAGQRSVWDALFTQLDRLAGARGNVPSAEVSVLDVGGGTGVYAVPLAQRGHRVTVLDPSPDALATLRRRSVDAGVRELVTPVLGDADLLGTPHLDAADLVLCHQILEYVDDPAHTLGRAAGAVRPGGTVSLIVQLRAGAVLARAMSGRVAEAAAILRHPEGRTGPGDPLMRRFDPDGLDALVTGAGLTVTHLAGLDLFQSLGDRRVHTDPATAAFEAQISSAAPYRDLAPTAHVLAQRSPTRDG